MSNQNTVLHQFNLAIRQAARFGKLSEGSALTCYNAAGDTDEQRWRFIQAIPHPKAKIMRKREGKEDKAENALADWFDNVSEIGTEIAVGKAKLPKASERTPAEDNKAVELTADRQRYLRIYTLVRLVAHVQHALVAKGLKVTFAKNDGKVNKPVLVQGGDGLAKEFAVGPFAKWNTDRIGKMPQGATLNVLLAALRAPRAGADKKSVNEPVFKKPEQVGQAMLNVAVYMSDTVRAGKYAETVAKDDTAYSEVYSALPGLFAAIQGKAKDQDAFKNTVASIMANLPKPVAVKKDKDAKAEAKANESKAKIKAAADAAEKRARDKALADAARNREEKKQAARKEPAAA